MSLYSDLRYVQDLCRQRRDLTWLNAQAAAYIFPNGKVLEKIRYARGNVRWDVRPQESKSGMDAIFEIVYYVSAVLICSCWIPENWRGCDCRWDLDDWCCSLHASKGSGYEGDQEERKITH